MTGPALALLTLLALAAPGSASAATLDVPADHATIQAAVDAADPGDTVAVKARNAHYNEGVEIDTSGITIRGVGGRPVINAFDPNSSSAPIEIDADNVVVRKLSLRHEDAYRCEGNGCSIRDVTFRGVFNSDCIRIDGDDARVTETRMESCGDNGVDLEGSDGRIEQNRANGIDSDCYFFEGTGHVVRNNAGERCEDGEGIDWDNGSDGTIVANAIGVTDNGGIELTGDGFLVRDNTVEHADSECYEVTGNDLTIEGNAAIDCDHGLDSTGDDVSASDNRVRGSHDNPCVRIIGESAAATGNRVDNCYRGIEIQGDGVATGNRVVDVHTDDGITFRCDDEVDEPDPPDPTACPEVLVANNVVDGTGDDDAGISVSVEDGTGNAVVRGNSVRDAFDDAIEVFANDSLIADNNATRAGAEEEEGIDVNGNGNLIRNNVATRNGGSGIQVTDGGGDNFGNVIRGNVVRDNNQDGINTNSDVDLVENNTATGNIGDGIEVNGVLTDVLGNTAGGNGGVDCANDGGIDEVSSNDCDDGSNFLVPSSGIGSP